MITAGSSNKNDNPFTWQGQFGVIQETGTSLFYMRYRYYDSAFARFLSRDRLFSPAPQEVNPYQYAAGNPVANVDPVGLKKVNYSPLLYDPAFYLIAVSFASEAITSPAVNLGIPIANTTTAPFDTSLHHGLTYSFNLGAESVGIVIPPLISHVGTFSEVRTDELGRPHRPYQPNFAPSVPTLPASGPKPFDIESLAQFNFHF